MLHEMIWPMRRRKLKFFPAKNKVSMPTSTPELIKTRPRARAASPHGTKQMTTSKYVAGQRAKARDIVKCLERKKIQLVAIDFDKTLLSIHTRGKYDGTLEDLLDSFRSTFHYLIQEILNSPNFGQTFHLCIVSFSSQELLIRNLLAFAFPHSKTDQIRIRCNTKDFLAESGSSISLGKESHLLSIIHEIGLERETKITPDRIVLFDDDERNIVIAQEFHHHALQIYDDVDLDILEEFVFDLVVSEK